VRSRLLLLVVVSLLASSCAAGTESVPPSTSGVGDDPAVSPNVADSVTVDAMFARATIVVGGVSLDVAIADTKDKRAQGLMFVTDMGEVDGMLFVFDDPAVRNFWMRNTRLPLDIVYFDAAGLRVGTYSMDPCPDSSTDCPGYPSAGPAMFALETVAGEYALSDAKLDVASVP
jgi:uncharacterized protein